MSNEDPQALNSTSVKNLKVDEIWEVKLVLKFKRMQEIYMGKVKILEIHNDSIELMFLEGPRKDRTYTISKEDWNSSDKIKQSGGKRKSRKSKKSKRTTRRR